MIELRSDSDISPTPALIFTEVKYLILAFQVLQFQNEVIHLKSETHIESTKFGFGRSPNSEILLVATKLLLEKTGIG